MNSQARLTGVIGSRLIGVDPYGLHSWSGISRFLFRECERQGILRRAIGAEVRQPLRSWLMARRFHPDRRVWRQHYYLDPAYRRALTAEVGRGLQAEDFEGGLLQIGAMFDLPALADGRCPCYSYHDGNLALRLRSPEGRRGLSAKWTDAAMAYERDLYHRLDRIFTMSEYLRSSFIEDFDVPTEKVVCIGAGVNLDEIPPPNPDKDYSAKEILFIGVEFERKGGDILLEAFRRVREKYPDAVLHVVGPPQLDRPIAQMTGVVHHGFLRKDVAADREKLDDLFLRSTLFVLPSLYEPFGIAPAEAMLHGIPAIVTGDWALGETVDDGENGWHVEGGSADRLVAALDLSLSDPVERKRRGMAAATKARREYKWEKIVLNLQSEISNCR